MKIFVTGGGTGGHLFPAMALGEELQKRGCDVHLVTDMRCLSYIKDCQLKTHISYLGYMRPGIVSKILLAVRMMLAIVRCLGNLIYYRPELVVGFGGYTAFPMLVAAKILFIPIMLHEQNCFLGKVNEMFARGSARLALNFAETSNLPTGIENKIVVSGNPVRNALNFKAIKRGAVKDSINLFVTGGSQGALVFSDIVPKAIQIVHKKIPELKISLVQQAKPETCEDLRQIYKTITEKAVVESFFHDMPQRYEAANLVICRSGASTIAELIHTGAPAIMIPFPGAAQDHQTYNAKVLESKEAGWVMPQSEITPEKLADKIIELVQDHGKLATVSEKLLKLKLPSEGILADEVEKIIHG